METAIHSQYWAWVSTQKAKAAVDDKTGESEELQADYYWSKHEFRELDCVIEACYYWTYDREVESYGLI